MPQIKCNWCKVFQITLKMRLHTTLINTINYYQPGFVRIKSRLSHLLMFMEDVSSYLDSDYPGDFTYVQGV